MQIALLAQEPQVPDSQGSRQKVLEDSGWNKSTKKRPIYLRRGSR